MSGMSDAIAGLKTTLEANIPGLHVYNHPPDAIHEYPAAVLLLENIDPEIAFAGNSIDARVRCVFMYASGLSEEAFASVYDAIDPTETNKSVVKAVRADPTLDGKVDDAEVVAIENIGRRDPQGGYFAGFEAVVRFIKTIA